MKFCSDFKIMEDSQLRYDDFQTKIMQNNLEIQKFKLYKQQLQLKEAKINMTVYDTVQQIIKLINDKSYVLLVDTLLDFFQLQEEIKNKLKKDSSHDQI